MKSLGGRNKSSKMTIMVDHFLMKKSNIFDAKRQKYNFFVAKSRKYICASSLQTPDITNEKDSFTILSLFFFHGFQKLVIEGTFLAKNPTLSDLVVSPFPFSFLVHPSSGSRYRTIQLMLVVPFPYPSSANILGREFCFIVYPSSEQRHLLEYYIGAMHFFNLKSPTPHSTRS